MENNEIIAAADKAQQINEVFNHSQRRRQVRETMRNQRYYKMDNNGVQHSANVLRDQTMKERYNFKNWIERVKRSQEVGRKIHRIHEEQVYNEMVKNTEEREAKYLRLLIEHYGEDEAKKIHDKHISDFDKRLEKKLNKKHNLK